LVDLALQISGQRRSPSPDRLQSSEGLLASTGAAPKSRTSFPPSKGVVESLQKAFEKFSAGGDSADSRPETLPSEATTQVQSSKFAKNFNLRFHGGSSFPLAALSAKPSPEELSYLRPRAEPSVSITKLSEVEVLLRKAVRTLSTLDWLLNTLKEVSQLPHLDELLVDSLWANVQKTLRTLRRQRSCQPSLLGGSRS
jgi:hypothetical protein